MRTVTALAGLLVCIGCGGASDASSLTIFAASSLTESFTDIEEVFESRHDSVDVTIAFAGSQVLRVQIEQGAKPDLFASADEEHIEVLRDKGLIRSAISFTFADLVLVTPVGDSTIQEFEDLVTADRIVIGTEGVPVGRYARQAIDNSRRLLGDAFADEVRARVVSEETNARLVRAKVELGEADAALIYRPDALASDRVRIVEMPPGISVFATYWVAELERSPTYLRTTPLAGEWIEMLTNHIGERVFPSRGFGRLGGA